MTSVPESYQSDQPLHSITPEAVGGRRVVARRTQQAKAGPHPATSPKEGIVRTIKTGVVAAIIIGLLAGSAVGVAAQDEATAVEFTGATGFGSPLRISEPFTDPRLAGEFRVKINQDP